MNIDRIAPRKARPSGLGMGDLYHWFQNLLVDIKFS